MYKRTGAKPFKNIDDVISREELMALSASYKRGMGWLSERAAQKNVTTTKGSARVHPPSPSLSGRPGQQSCFQLNAATVSIWGLTVTPSRRPG